MGPLETIQLFPKGGCRVRLTRNALKDLGASLVKEVNEKEIIGVEFSDCNGCFVLGKVLNPLGPRTLSSTFESFIGKFIPGDVVLDVRRLESASLVSSMKEFTYKDFPFFVEDVRKRNMQDCLEKLNLARITA